MPIKPVTLQTLRKYKQENEKFAVLTSYDATFAHVVSSAGVEMILVGDSLGMILQGHDSTIPVTIDDIAYHTRCVAAGNQGAMIMADLPFGGAISTQETLEQSVQLMRAGAHIIKIEGGAWLVETFKEMKRCGIPVCAHLGLTPQYVNAFGGYKIQGKEKSQADVIFEGAVELDQAGADMLLLECVPSGLGTRITEAVEAPVIGIGAGPKTDAQVLVAHDMLNLTQGRKARFVQDFMTGYDDGVSGAITRYVHAVKTGEYPKPEHEY